MSRHESALEVTAKGAVAGLVGTAALTLAMSQAPKLMKMMGQAPPRQGGGKKPPEKLAEKVAEGVFDQSLSDETQQIAGQAVHWGYGAAWGAFYGIAQSSLRLPHFLHGTIFGGLVAAVASTLMPSMGLTPPPTEQPAQRNAMQLVLHLLYGWVTALVFHFLSSEG